MCVGWEIGGGGSVPERRKGGRVTLIVEKSEKCVGVAVLSATLVSGLARVDVELEKGGGGEGESWTSLVKMGGGEHT